MKKVVALLLLAVAMGVSSIAQSPAPTPPPPPLPPAPTPVIVPPSLTDYLIWYILNAAACTPNPGTYHCP